MAPVHRSSSYSSFSQLTSLSAFFPTATKAAPAPSSSSTTAAAPPAGPQGAVAVVASAREYGQSSDAGRDAFGLDGFFGGGAGGAAGSGGVGTGGGSKRGDWGWLDFDDDDGLSSEFESDDDDDDDQLVSPASSVRRPAPLIVDFLSATSCGAAAAGASARVDDGSELGSPLLETSFGFTDGLFEGDPHPSTPGAISLKSVFSYFSLPDLTESDYTAVIARSSPDAADIPCQPKPTGPPSLAGVDLLRSPSSASAASSIVSSSSDAHAREQAAEDGDDESSDVVVSSRGSSIRGAGRPSGTRVSFSLKA